jgi:hypothetical protein
MLISAPSACIAYFEGAIKAYVDLAELRCGLHPLSLNYWPLTCFLAPLQVTKSIESGLYSPWTLSGSIIVDGVAAAMHTAWPGEQALLHLLPPGHPRHTAAHWLAQAHQLLLAPLRVFYRLAGPKPFRALDEAVDYFMNQGEFTAATAAAKVTGDDDVEHLMIITRAFQAALPLGSSNAWAVATAASK